MSCRHCIMSCGYTLINLFSLLGSLYSRRMLSEIFWLDLSSGGIQAPTDVLICYRKLHEKQFQELEVVDPRAHTFDAPPIVRLLIWKILHKNDSILVWDFWLHLWIIWSWFWRREWGTLCSRPNRRFLQVQPLFGDVFCITRLHTISYVNALIVCVLMFKRSALITSSRVYEIVAGVGQLKSDSHKTFLRVIGKLYHILH